MSAPKKPPAKRRAIPPFEVHRDPYGFAVSIDRGGWVVLHLGYSKRNEENVEAVVARLNAAPLDWPSRHNGRKRRLAGGRK